MKILVTGAAGFIGGSLAAHFRARGSAVAVDAQRGHSGTTRRWPLSEEALADATIGHTPDLIIHAAGSGTVGKVAAHPTIELPANLGALLAVLQFAKKRAPRARIVLLSSAALYGNAPGLPQKESDVRDPVSLYGVAKSQAEQLAAYYCRHEHLVVTAVRLFSVYGPGLRKQLLWDAMNKFQVGEAIFFGTGQERRDWVHIEDVCSFVDHLVAKPPAQAFDVYNCAGSPGTTSEVLSALAQAAHAPPPRFNGESRPGDPLSLVANCGKALKQLGWQAQVPWSRGVPAYASWFARLGLEGVS